MANEVLVDRYSAWLVYSQTDLKRLIARNSETHESICVPYTDDNYQHTKDYLLGLILRIERGN